MTINLQAKRVAMIYSLLLMALYAVDVRAMEEAAWPTIDLRDHIAEEGASLVLEGHVGFLPEKFSDDGNPPIDFANHAEILSFRDGFGSRSHRHGSFWFRLKLPENAPSALILEFKRVAVYELFVNGKSYGGHGTLNTKEGPTKWNFKRGIHSIPIDSDALDIVINASSFHISPAQGRMFPLKLIWGTKSHLKRIDLTEIIDFSVFCLAAFMVFYHIILGFSQKGHRAPFWFAGISLSCLCHLIAYSKFFLAFTWVESWPELSLFLTNQAPVSLSISMIFFLWALFPSLAPKASYNLRLHKLWVTIGLLLLSSLLLLPYQLYSHLMGIHRLYLCLSMLVSIVIIIKACLNRLPGAGLIAWGGITVAVSTILQILSLYGFFSFHFPWASFSFFVFLSCQAAAIAIRFSRAFVELEKSEREIVGLNHELKQHLQDLDQKVIEQTFEIKTILESLNQAVIVFDEQGNKIGEDSPYTKGIFGQQKNHIRDFFTDSDLTNDQKSQIESVINMSIGSNRIGFESCALSLPQRILLKRGNEDRVLEITWQPIVNEKDETIKILVSFRDITQFERMQQDSLLQRTEVAVLMELLATPLSYLHTNFKVIESSAEAIRSCCRSEDPEIMFTLQRDLHTLKGNARVLGLKRLADASHDLEQIIATENIKTPSNVRNHFKKLDAELNFYKNVIREKVAHPTHETISIDKDTGLEILKTLSQANTCSKELIDKLSFQLINRIDAILKAEIHDLPSLSSVSGKLPPTIEFIGKETPIPEFLNPTIIKVFSHLFRNSIAHGIEAADQRTAHDKPPAGHISIHIKKFTDSISLHYSDDGAGLDINKIRSKIELENNTAIDTKEIVRNILRPSFSTSEEVTDISGRGIGMSAIVSYVEELGGRFEIVFDEKFDKNPPEFLPVKFKISLPYTKTSRVA
ncbi:MAG: Hpt domain-containing protein [Pseudobacteriovorax sp.]|nr:Hpt domain-containing protein [Pseudobacteriovorax sp.]